MWLCMRNILFTTNDADAEESCQRKGGACLPLPQPSSRIKESQFLLLAEENQFFFPLSTFAAAAAATLKTVSCLLVGALRIFYNVANRCWHVMSAASLQNFFVAVFCFVFVFCKPLMQTDLNIVPMFFFFASHSDALLSSAGGSLFLKNFVVHFVTTTITTLLHD